MILGFFRYSSLAFWLIAGCADALAAAPRFQSHHRTAIVTGANGYLGKTIVHELLDNGDGFEKVFCLVRSSCVETETQYWHRVKDASRGDCDVKVLPYDMMDGGATVFQALELAAGGGGDEPSSCCVFHVASNFGPSENHTQSALENVQGTEDLVRTMAKHFRLRQQEYQECHKLILTSSMAAVRGSGQTPKNNKFYTIEDWNTMSELGANWGSSYQWSKAQSERRALELAMELGVPIVSLCPSFLFGPTPNLESTTSFSVELVGKWLRGEAPVQSRLFADVRDAARAHVAAACTSSSESGQRYIVSTEARVPSAEIAKWLANVCIETGLSDPSKIQYDAKFSGGAVPIGDQEVEAEQRLLDELGVKLRPVKKTIVEMARTLLGCSDK
ncbi:hypothetical protein ACA910_005229 [Epithemia clementina (nom. ined.)]